MSVCLLMLIILVQCTPTGETCTGCASPALSIVTVNASRDTLLPRKIKMISPDSSKVWFDTSGSRMAIYGNPGVYTLDILYADGGIVPLKNVKVKQSPRMTCDHPVPENFLIKKTDALKKGTAGQTYDIVSQISGGGCG